MNPIKMLGLAATAALMAMAFVGVGSAVAESTTLCLEDPGEGKECPKGSPESQLITHVHEATLAGNPALLLSSTVEIKCDVLFLGDTTSKSGKPLKVLGNLTYTNCKTSGGTACTVAEKSTDTTASILKLGHELADVTYVFEVNFKCGFLINCTYNGVGLEAHALGPLLAAEVTGETRLEEQTMNKTGGSLCPETAKLDILATPLEAVYIAE
jgi:hypothetical protein